MPDEQGYVSYLLDFQAAMDRLHDVERVVLQKAYDLWRADAEIGAYWSDAAVKWQQWEEEMQRARERKAALDAQAGTSAGYEAAETEARR